MEERELKFTLRVFGTKEKLGVIYNSLLIAALKALENSYSPYSNFKVAAAVLLANGEIVTGTNQENAAFPAGICAEGTALSAASSLYPGIAIKKIFITVKSGNKKIDHPVAPCGICRQRILEYETRFNSDIEIIMWGGEGEVYAVDSVKDILPLSFSKSDL